MKKIILLLMSILILFIIFCLFKYVNFVEGENEDVEIKFNIAKNYIHELSFEGFIEGKHQTEKEFFINISLIKIDSLPTLSQQCTFTKYYEFKGDTILILSVPYNIFNRVKILDPISKQTNSNNLRIQNDTLLFLSPVKGEWFSYK